MGEFRTLRLKSILFILIIIFLSFLICATTPPPQKYKYNIDISLNVPTKHKVTVLIYGDGSVLVNKVKNNGETLTFNRLDTININFMPDKNYVVYKILLNDIDITSSIQNNTFIIHNISEDYTLKIWFTLNEKYKNSSIDNLAIINNQITKEFSKITLPYINNFIKTGDKNFFIICSLIFTAILSLIYLSYYIGIKINSFTIYQNKYSLPLLYLIYPLAESI